MITSTHPCSQKGAIDVARAYVRVGVPNKGSVPPCQGPGPHPPPTLHQAPRGKPRLTQGQGLRLSSAKNSEPNCTPSRVSRRTRLSLPSAVHSKSVCAHLLIFLVVSHSQKRNSITQCRSFIIRLGGASACTHVTRDPVQASVQLRTASLIDSLPAQRRSTVHARGGRAASTIHSMLQLSPLECFTHIDTCHTSLTPPQAASRCARRRCSRSTSRQRSGQSRAAADCAAQGSPERDPPRRWCDGPAGAVASWAGVASPPGSRA